MTAPPIARTPASAYTQVLLAARARGLEAGRRELTRITQSVAQAQRDLLAIERRYGLETLTGERASGLRREMGAAMRALETRLGATGSTSLRLIVRDVLGLHRAATESLMADVGKRLSSTAAARFDLLNANVLTTLAQRRGGVAVTYQTLIKRSMQDAAPVLDRMLEAGISRGASIGGLARSVSEVLGGRRPSDPSFRLPRLGGLSSIDPDARRIARSETMNTLREANRAGMLQGGVVEAVKWQTSGNHPEVDDCDVLATQDLYDLGPGFYPPGLWPIAPHPNCGCYQGAVKLRKPKAWGTPYERVVDAERAPAGSGLRGLAAKTLGPRPPRGTPERLAWNRRFAAWKKQQVASGALAQATTPAPVRAPRARPAPPPAPPPRPSGPKDAAPRVTPEIVGEVTLRFKQELTEALDSMPERFHRLVNFHGAKLRTGRFLNDLNPTLSGRFRDIEGVYIGDPMRPEILVSEMYQQGTDALRSHRVPGTVRHEFGHAVDYAGHALQSTNRAKFSDTSAFREAYRYDLENMPESAKNVLSYFVEGRSIGNGAREAFAESFALAHGSGGLDNAYMVSLFRQWFPNTMGVVKDIINAIPELS